MTADNTPGLLRVTLGIKYRQLDPIESRPETGAPNDIRYIENGTVIEHRLSLIDASTVVLLSTPYTQTDIGEPLGGPR